MGGGSIKGIPLKTGAGGSRTIRLGRREPGNPVRGIETASRNISPDPSENFPWPRTAGSLYRDVLFVPKPRGRLPEALIYEVQWNESN